MNYPHFRGIAMVSRVAREAVGRGLGLDQSRCMAKLNLMLGHTLL